MKGSEQSARLKSKVTKGSFTNNQQFNKNWEIYLYELQNLKECQDDQLWRWAEVQNFNIENTKKTRDFNFNNKTNLLLNFLRNSRSKLMTTSCSIFTRFYQSENSKNQKEQSYLLCLSQQLISNKYLIKLLNSANKLIACSANELIKTILISINFGKQKEDLNRVEIVKSEKISQKILRNLIEQFILSKNSYVKQQISMYLMVVFSESGCIFLKYLIDTLQQSQRFNLKSLDKVCQPITIQNMLSKGLAANSSKVRQNTKQVKRIIEQRLAEVQNGRFANISKMKGNQTLVQQSKCQRKKSDSFIHRNSVNRSIIKQNLQQDSQLNSVQNSSRVLRRIDGKHDKQDYFANLKIVYANIENKSSNWIAKFYEINMFFELLNILITTKHQNEQIEQFWKIQYVMFLVELLSEKKNKLNIRSLNFFKDIFQSIKSFFVNQSMFQNTINLSSQYIQMGQSLQPENSVNQQISIDFFQTLVNNDHLREQFLMQIVRNYSFPTAVQNNTQKLFVLFIELANYKIQIVIYLISQLNRMFSEQEQSFTRKNVINLMDMLITYFSRGNNIIKQNILTLNKPFKQLLTSLKRIFIVNKYKDKKDMNLPALTLFSQLKSLNCALTSKQFAKFPQQAVERIVLLAKQIDPKLQKQLMEVIKNGRIHQKLDHIQQTQSVNKQFTEQSSNANDQILEQVKAIRRLLTCSNKNSRQQISWCLSKISQVLFDYKKVKVKSVTQESLFDKRLQFQDFSINCYCDVLSLISLFTDIQLLAQFRIMLSYLCEPIQGETQIQSISLRTNYLRALFIELTALWKSFHDKQQDFIYCALLLSLIHEFLSNSLQQKQSQCSEIYNNSIDQIQYIANSYIEALIQIWRMLSYQTNVQSNTTQIKMNIMRVFKYQDQSTLQKIMHQNEFKLLLLMDQSAIDG